jgi:tetraacyldisaccharide 4'-kinase
VTDWTSDAWTGRTAGGRALRAALVPAAIAYGAGTAVRNRLYDAGIFAARRVPARVISVGNLTVGGTGKTPTTLWLAERLRARGARVGIVARGYRKERPGVVVVGESGRPLVEAREGGDEAVLLARRFAGPVVTGERRAEAAGFACARFGLDAIVLDDGFQHRALARDADLVLLAGDEAVQWPLPAGPLREWASGLARADAVLAVDGQASGAPDRPLFHGRLRPTAFVRVDGDAWVEEPLASLAGREVIALAGIARPERLGVALVRAGAAVRDTLRFPDHHAYGADDVATIARATRAATVVATEKDLAKLGGVPGLEELRALRVSLEVERGDALVELLAGGPAASGFARGV